MGKFSIWVTMIMEITFPGNRLMPRLKTWRTSIKCMSVLASADAKRNLQLERDGGKIDLVGVENWVWVLPNMVISPKPRKTSRKILLKY